MRLVSLVLIALALALPAVAQMVTGADAPGFAATFDLENQADAYEAQPIAASTGSSTGTTILWPNEELTLTLRLVNKTEEPIVSEGFLEVIHYGTRGTVGEIWAPQFYRIARLGKTPVSVEVPAGGTQLVEVKPSLIEEFGGYGLVLDLPSYGRRFVCSAARVMPADAGRVQFPTLGIDLVWPFEMTEATFTARQRVGTKAARMEVGYFESASPDYERRWRELQTFLGWAKAHDYSVMLTLGAGGPQPLGRPRPWLDEKGNFLDTKTDIAWLPEYDEDFQQWVRKLCVEFGWPKGPVNAVELWNEPWEGISISGWGADIPRYRAIYRHMALGVEEARKQGAQVLIGGACSSSNTLDKLFPDGSDEFLKWLDFTSIHYQAMAAAPALIKSWQSRKSPLGPVRVWDTESWIANTDERVAVVIASMRAQGQERTNGIYSRNVFEQLNFDDNEHSVVAGWSAAASLAAAQKFLGERPFRELLFKKGLPWIFVFDGPPPGSGLVENPDDGTVVVVGDLSGLYDRELLLFRGVEGLANLDSGAPVLEGASLTLPREPGIRAYDFYGNELPAQGETISAPLNGLGYFLRTDGSPGSFSRLLAALKQADIEGYEPLDIIAHDLTQPVEQHPKLRLTLTNILNRPVSGLLSVKLGDLNLEKADREVSLKAGQTKEVTFRIASGQPSPDNAYPLSVTFDAGSDGRAVLTEKLHVNFITHRAISVDGRLDDWEGALPQVGSAKPDELSLTEQAWLPFKEWEPGTANGVAAGYFAWDEQAFYFAAKIADETPDEGTLRFETPDWEQFFYPQTSYDKGQALTWPEGVRRYSYRKDPILPSGDFPRHDNVQLAFNVIPDDKEPWATHPPGTMPRFMCYLDTDYEYALNQVAPEWGGGVEVWRMLVPGMPRKHFYPRQPASPYDGPVKSARLVLRRDATTRYVELALPWSELPDVWKLVSAGKPIKVDFRVNDNEGASYELAAERSVSKRNFPAFHCDWQPHWANELEFGIER